MTKLAQKEIRVGMKFEVTKSFDYWDTTIGPMMSELFRQKPPLKAGDMLVVVKAPHRSNGRGNIIDYSLNGVAMSSFWSDFKNNTEFI